VRLLVAAAVIALGALGCGLETNAIVSGGRVDGGATDGGGGAADSGMTGTDGGSPRDGGARDGGPSDGGAPDAGPPYRPLFTLDPTDCPSEWDDAGYVDGCVEERFDCDDAQSSFFVDPGGPWQELRGFVRGLQGQTPDGFAGGLVDLDDVYVDGISITTEAPRQHLWTFAAGLYKPTSPGDGNACPCDNGDPPPAIVGDRWTCETGNDMDSFVNMGPIYLDDVLWDADGDAHGDGCTPVAAPGWFHVRLPAPTTARIEVRIMADSCDDRVTLTALELEVR
jgi:hypothetical protein